LVEALEGFIVSLELLVNDAEPEIDFIGLFKVLIHPKNAREGLFGVLERAIAIVENADAVPKLCILLWTMEMEEGVLISIICTLKLILHEKAMSEGAPYVAVLVVDLNSTIEIFDSPRIVFSATTDMSRLCQRSP
jgi:hypothetical protein